MSKKSENKGQATTVCNHTVMEEAAQTLGSMEESLLSAYEMVQPLLADFLESYEGDAQGEVGLFLENLPLHIYKLNMLYNKMAGFVQATDKSFQQNDKDMTDNMERQG